eukprot:15365523-Ditylum_brightwellii.AAC.1
MCKAANHNMQLLQAHSTIFYGYKYHPINNTDAFLSNHPQWEALCTNITHGVDYPLEPLFCLLHHKQTHPDLDYEFAIPINILLLILFAKVYPSASNTSGPLMRKAS